MKKSTIDSKTRKERIMTKREFFNAVITANINDELTAYAAESIEKLDKSAEHRKNTPTKAQRENEPIKEAIMSLFVAGAAPLTGAEIAATLELTPQKTNALLRQLASNGALNVEEVKNGKRLINAYTLAD